MTYLPRVAFRVIATCERRVDEPVYYRVSDGVMDIVRNRVRDVVENPFVYLPDLP